MTNALAIIYTLACFAANSFWPMLGKETRVSCS